MKDREQIERCLQAVLAYKSSGQKASEWCAANGISVGDLSSWCCHAQRWQAKLDGKTPEPRGQVRSSGGFVAARLPASAPSTVRIEAGASGFAVVLHWPVSHARELAGWVREVSR
jgi:hypothetical protein